MSKFDDLLVKYDELNEDFEKLKNELERELKKPFRGVQVDIIVNPPTKMVAIDVVGRSSTFTVYCYEDGVIDYNGISNEQANKFTELCKEYIG